jgi:hypothetical protein
MVLSAPVGGGVRNYVIRPAWCFDTAILCRVMLCFYRLFGLGGKVHSA